MAKKRNKCPECGSDAFYRYGKTANGKTRRLCLICDRQYIVDWEWTERPGRPNCPVCSQPMHVYMRQGRITRYRCRNYPECREYVTVSDRTISREKRMSDDE
jgi:ssDNA-binding Zn-finger/Zn-ribbon topoisomerase 1